MRSDATWPDARANGASESAQSREGAGRAATPAERRARASQLVAEGLMLRARHKMKDAAALFASAMQESPEDLDALNCRGLSLKQLGDTKNAMTCFGRAVTVDERDWRAHNNRGVLLKESGQLTEAIESYEKAIQCFHQQFGAADTAPVPRGYVVEGAVDGAGAAIMAGDGVMRCVTKDSMAVVLTDLGTRLKLAGNVEEGIARYREALRFNANYAPAYFNLGVAYSESGHFAEALRFYNMALDRNPQYVEVLCNIGVIRKNTGHLESAISYYERAVRVNPNFMIANNNLAIAYTDMGTKVKNEGRIEEGIMYYKRSLQHNPKYPDAWYNLGVAHAEQGRFDDALVCYELAVSFNSNCAQAYNNLGVIYKDRGNLERAIACYQNALKANPSFAQTLNNLGVIYTMLGQLDQAYLYCQRAIQTNPDYAEAFNNLGVLFRDEGRILEALDSYASCLRLDPDSRSAGQNRLLALNSLTEDVLDRLADPTRQSLVMHASAHAAFIAGVRPPSSFADVVRLVFEEHRSWGRRFSALFPAARHWDNEPRRDRVLRIGYLSADFFTHSVSYFIEAPLRFADRRRFFVVCYSNVGREDAKTERLRKLAHAWRSVVGLNTQQVCQMVRDDRIDILVELTGHTAGNRLDVMAAKPAPVQVSWIGYPNTTGLETVDYRLSDAVADPPASEQQYVEELVRFDGPFLCYTPLHDAPEPSPSPALRQGFVTFGSFNNLAKVNDRLLSLWSRIMARVPNARLLMKCKPFASESSRQMMLARLERIGIDPRRADLLPLLPSTSEHLRTYSMVDIALDSFPYAGTTTTCEALYMGVPVVTLGVAPPAAFHAHNVSVSLLSRIPLMRDFIATNDDEYVDLAARWALDTQRLAEVRRSLRAAMLESPLCDGERSTRSLEEIYTRMWARWCERPARSPRQ